MREKALLMGEIILILLIGISSIFFVIYPTNSKIIVDFQLIGYLLILLNNYRCNKFFNLYQTWIAAYIFIIWSEMEIMSVGPFSETYVIPFARYTLANFSFLLGYHIIQNNKSKETQTNYYFTRNSMFIILIVLLYLYYITSKYVETRNVFYSGRSYGSGSALGNGTLIGELTKSLGILLPALIGYYFSRTKNKKIWISLFLSLPIFAILLITTSRYKLLFSILPFLIVTGVIEFNKTSIKKNILLLFLAAIIIVVTGFSKKNRNIALIEVDFSEVFYPQTSKGDDFFENLAYQMSPEGVVKMASIADDYFSTHDLHYGKESAFILYFWIPRSWWPNKPTMLDSWLIRKYENVSEGFSSASGFIGELRADFGWFCLFFIFIFGMLIHKLDNYIRNIVIYNPQSYTIVFISALYPWIFFFVRSPITSTMGLFWTFIIWKIVARTIPCNPSI